MTTTCLQSIAKPGASFCRYVGLLILLLALAPAGTASAGQSISATLSGTVVDSTGAILAGATIKLVDTATLAERQVVSARNGAFILTTLPPGRYILRATNDGFAPTELRDVVLNVNDRVAVTVEMALAERGERLTVVAEALRVNTSPAVSTVVDRQFVENLPLNGRSLQSLIELTPGVVLTRTNSNEGGQFSVNGQRANANYFTVDGVSANAGTTASSIGFPGQAGSGQLPSLTALGGTNSLVSVDALQEFRIQTSTYAPEFGRTPGGQIALVTRTGTNQLTGSVFDYYRDEMFDANDWFANRAGLPKPDLLQHNFGAVLGGPILRSRTFFFGSYEGLRLTQPQSKRIFVPNAASRQAAIPEVRPLLDVIPMPNGPDVAGGLAEFNASYSDTARLDSTSVRVDHTVRSGLSLFGRGTYAPSYTNARGPFLANTAKSTRNNTTATLGSVWIVGPRIVHDIRANYASNDAPYFLEPDGFGGASLPPLDVFIPGRSPDNAVYTFAAASGAGSWSWGTGTNYVQRQLNVVDSLSVLVSDHDFKLGMDYLRTNPLLSGRGGRGLQQLQFNIPGLAQGRAVNYTTYESGTDPLAALFQSLSLYAQDTWRVTSRLTVTYGIRWEFVPTARASKGPNAITLNNIDDPYGGQVSVASRNTPLWRTRYDNFAPRLGGSLVLSDTPGAQLVLRGGFGTFHDLGFGQVATAYRSYPFAGIRSVSSPAFPLSAATLSLPRLEEDPPQSITMMDPQLRLPFTYQWNASMERSLGPRQTVTVGYIGAEGRRLLKLDRYNIRLVEWPASTTPVNVGRNRGYSDYHALQLQFQRRLHHGLQGMTSYTYGRSRDTSSSDIATNIPAERLPPELDFGYSDYDVRHVFTSAITYQLPEFSGSSFHHRLASGWGLDVMLRVRSGYPINVSVGVPFPPETFSARPNVIPGQPFWIDDTNAPGGRRLNGLAFSLPPANTQGDLTRGVIRGFSARQVDAALRRTFSVAPGVRLQLRFEMFNLFNTANFSDPSNVTLGDNPTSGLSSQMLGRGLGGLSPLYQMGGPRSTQFAAKILF